jgi:hypothetical protein
MNEWNAGHVSGSGFGLGLGEMNLEQRDETFING